ncbi:MAG TPA: DNA-processing protein DprA, partial [Gemmatimonadales bacterium]|nr:DNA-processing protein DprA [Gemmatimonadales bacterium]
TLIIEAAVGSGALITAGTALDQGREVVAVPGPITSAQSVGCNRLIRDGATPYLEPVDLAQFYPEVTFRPPEPPGGPGPRPATLSALHRQVAQSVGPDGSHLDTIVAQCGQPVGRVLAILCALELQGLVAQAPGRLFRRI